MLPSGSPHPAESSAHVLDRGLPPVLSRRPARLGGEGDRKSTRLNSSPSCSSRTDTLFPYTTLFRSLDAVIPERMGVDAPSQIHCLHAWRIAQKPGTEQRTDA